MQIHGTENNDFVCSHVPGIEKSCLNVRGVTTENDSSRMSLDRNKMKHMDALKLGDKKRKYYYSLGGKLLSIK